MHGVLKAPLFAFTLACVAGLSFDAFFIKENRWGNCEDSFSPFTSCAFSSAPAWGCLEHTLGRKTTKKPPATQAIFTLTAEHRHTAIWCQYGYFGWFQQKKPYSLLWESPIALLCSHIAVTNRHISWLFHQVWKRPLKPTVCQMSYLSLLKWPQVVSKYCHGHQIWPLPAKYGHPAFKYAHILMTPLCLCVSLTDRFLISVTYVRLFVLKYVL